MKSIMLFFFVITSPVHASDIRIAYRDSVPDSTKKSLPSGLKTSGLSLGAGAGSVAFGTFMLTQAGNPSFDDKSGLYAIGLVVGIVAVISGIVSLGRNRRLVKAGNSAQREDVRRTRKRATTGIILGVLGMVASVAMMLLNSGGIGW